MNHAHISLGEKSADQPVRQITNGGMLSPEGTKPMELPKDGSGGDNNKPDTNQYGFKELKRQYDEETSEARRIDALQKVLLDHLDQW